MRRKRVLIPESSFTGHHPSYLQWIVAAARRASLHVTVGTSREATQSNQFVDFATRNTDVSYASEPFGSVPTYLKNFPASIKSQFLHWRLVKKLYSASGPFDLVFLPYMDAAFYGIAIFGSPFGVSPWGGIMMRADFHHARSGIIGAHSTPQHWIKATLARRVFAMSSCKIIRTLDPCLCEAVESKHRSKVRFLPDPAPRFPRENRTVARSLLNIPPEGVILLVFGDISPRKGVLDVLSALQSGSVPDSVHVLLAGKLSPEVEAALSLIHSQNNQTQRRIHILSGYLDDYQAGLALSASNFMWLGYRGHQHMSGNIALAAQFDLAMISTPEGLIGWFTKRNNSGVLLRAKDGRALDYALSEVLSDSKREVFLANARGAYKNFTQENAIAIMSEDLIEFG